MFLTYVSPTNIPVLISLDDKRLIISGNTLTFYGQSDIIGVSNDATALLARFNDIVDALDSGNVNVYDVRKDVGYWKPKTRAHSTAKKPAAKSGGDA